MSQKDVYESLAEHLSSLAMGYPMRDDLLTILRENYTEQEAKVALAIPNNIIPLQPVSLEEIQERTELPGVELETTLENLVQKGLVYYRKTGTGEKGYALHQVGFGFPQTFFWKGEDTPQARKMAGLVAKYFNRKVTTEAYGSDTKPYRYIPIGKSLHPEKQAVLPQHMMEKVIQDARQIAVAHCPCRVSFQLLGKTCPHPTEVCMKFNDMAEYVIDRGLAKEISKENALEIIKKTEDAGLVHFVDNAEGEIQHNCNCCGCACWNVGNIRRRKIPRDAIMATYFLRVTDEDKCIGCGECETICPVDAVIMNDELPQVDDEWCIGCGVCATVCPSDAITMKIRPDRTEKLPAGNVKDLHEKILAEKGLTASNA